MHPFPLLLLQVSRRLGSMLYMMNLPLSTAALQATPEKPGERSSEIGSPINCNSEEMVASPRDPDVLKSAEHLHEVENNSPPSASSETAWPVMVTGKQTQTKTGFASTLWWWTAATVVAAVQTVMNWTLKDFLYMLYQGFCWIFLHLITATAVKWKWCGF